MTETRTLGSRAILVVEDDSSVAEMYRLKLEMDGYRVRVAGDGVEALAQALDDPPDLIILDIHLPKVDGLGVLERLGAETPTAAVPIVVLSSYSEPELVERCRALGAREYLLKSHTTPRTLSARARHWLSA